MIPYCRSTGVGLIPWSPLSRGLLSRPIGESTKRVESDPGFKGRGYDAPPKCLVEVNKACVCSKPLRFESPG
jgi:aryl-alcohol dehydrogenase-like predicted oxidoreductase